MPIPNRMCVSQLKVLVSKQGPRFHFPDLCSDPAFQPPKLWELAVISQRPLGSMQIGNVIFH